MRNFVWVSILAFLGLGSADLSTSARAQDDNSNAHSHESDDGVYEWCLRHFPYADEAGTTASRSMAKLVPFKLDDMIAPADLVTKTEIVGRLPGYIRKYRGFWVWPTTIEPPLFAIFVERLSEKEMTIAFLSRATEDNKDYRERLRKNAREKLTWDGTAFSAGPEGELESTTSIYISAFSDALLLVRANKREGFPPLCFISSKRY